MRVFVTWYWTTIAIDMKIGECARRGVQHGGIDRGRKPADTKGVQRTSWYSELLEFVSPVTTIRMVQVKLQKCGECEVVETSSRGATARWYRSRVTIVNERIR